MPVLNESNHDQANKKVEYKKKRIKYSSFLIKTFLRLDPILFTWLAHKKKKNPKNITDCSRKGHKSRTIYQQLHEDL